MKLTELKAIIEEHIKVIEDDSRYQDEAANVEVNAPLALIQVDMKAKVRTCKWILDSINKILNK